MKVFDKVIDDKERNKFVYEVDKYNLEELGEEERKMGMAKIYVYKLAQKYPQKEKELLKIHNDISKLAQDCFEDAEKLLMLKGMDNILENLYRVLKDE